VRVCDEDVVVKKEIFSNEGNGLFYTFPDSQNLSVGFVCGILSDPENPPTTFGISRCLSIPWSSSYKCLMHVVSEGIDVAFSGPYFVVIAAR
jgi:hypothetical protein